MRRVPGILVAGFAALASFAAAAAQAPADAGAATIMEPRMAACAACHGKEGRSKDEAYYPSIAGKPAGYLYQQLLNFREGRRHHAVMQGMFAYLSDDYLQAIAAYYASREPLAHQAAPAPDAAAAAQALDEGHSLVEAGDKPRGIPPCSVCHGERLTGVAPAIPGLVGLPPAYLTAQLGAWASGVRKARDPDCMGEIARKLSARERAAVVAWIASRTTTSDHRPAAQLIAPLPMQCGGVQ